MSRWLDMHGRPTGAWPVARHRWGWGSGQFAIAAAHVLRHAIDDDDSAAEPTLLAADTRIPVVGESAFGGEWPRHCVGVEPSAVVALGPRRDT